MPNEFCVYLTTYSGDKMPSLYVGSTSVTRVTNGYHGSVSSKKYEAIWKSELRCNPRAFKTEILSLHDTRHDAVRAEIVCQHERDAVHSPHYINQAYANGKFIGNITPEQVEVWRIAYDSRSATEKEAYREHCRQRQFRIMASRSPEQVRQTAEKQSHSLAATHAKKTPAEKEAIAMKKRRTLSIRSDQDKALTRAARSASMSRSWAIRKGASNE